MIVCLTDGYVFKQLIVALFVVQRATSVSQMNPRPYLNALTHKELRHRGEYFEVYSTTKSLRYADVNQKQDEPVRIPEPIISRFANKVMGITGWETDIEQFDVSSGKWVTAKCTELYTHHYIVSFRSSKLTSADHLLMDHQTHHGHSTSAPGFPDSGHEVPPAGQEAPLVQTISHAEGNEHRGSFRGISAGAAMLLDSPATMHGVFHCINTKNPKCGTSTNCPNTGWGPGTGAPLPQASSFTKGSVAASHAKYSGLAECPCSTRRGDFREPDSKILQDATISNTTGYTFSAGCRPGGMLLMQQNPTCGSDTYNGGLQCCYDGMNLLDAEQSIPETVSHFRYKIRMYFIDYRPSFRGPAYDNSMYLFWQTEEWQTEYDIVKAPAGTPPRFAIHTLTTTFKARDLFGGWGTNWACAPTEPQCLLKRRNCSYVMSMGCGAGPSPGQLPGDGKFLLLYASMHQHTGLISGSLINQDTGELLCRTEPVYGKTDTAHDEEGYAVGIMPCLWNAGEDPSMPPPPVLHLDNNLLAIAEYNSSSYHYGVMSLWEMRGKWHASSTNDRQAASRHLIHV